MFTIFLKPISKATANILPCNIKVPILIFCHGVYSTLLDNPSSILYPTFPVQIPCHIHDHSLKENEKFIPGSKEQ